MKKYVTISFLLLAVGLGCSSCKKDYTCTCYDNAGNPQDKNTYNNITKDAAKDKCDNQNTYYSYQGGWCTLSSD